MQANDIIKITDVQTLDGYTGEILNVYYYLVESISTPVELPIAAQEIAVDFMVNVLTPVRALQVSQLHHIRLDFENMTDRLEIASYSWDAVYNGLRADDYLPGNVSFSFRLQRYNRLTRNGRKSYAGVPDTAVSSGRTLAPAFVPFVSAVSAAIGHYFNVETDDGLITLSPVIVRVPANPGVAVTQWNNVTQALFRGFGTQNSRKEL